MTTAPTPNPLTFRYVQPRHSKTPNDYTLNQMEMFEQETSMLADARKADTDSKGLSKHFHVSHAAGLSVVQASHPSPSLSASDPPQSTLYKAPAGFTQGGRHQQRRLPNAARRHHGG
ncbi:hypothetical protein PQX77_006551 [Marasmius sp. AFHP31]|nr:hypothetical protein PQX77_006551 [Marasmius sp. AFHP31]